MRSTGNNWTFILVRSWRTQGTDLLLLNEKDSVRRGSAGGPFGNSVGKALCFRAGHQVTPKAGGGSVGLRNLAERAT